MFLLIDQSGNTPSFCRSPATTATRAADLGAAAGAIEDALQHLGLALAGQAGQAHDLPLVAPAG